MEKVKQIKEKRKGQKISEYCSFLQSVKEKKNGVRRKEKGKVGKQNFNFFTTYYTDFLKIHFGMKMNLKLPYCYIPPPPPLFF